MHHRISFVMVARLFYLPVFGI